MPAIEDSHSISAQGSSSPEAQGTDSAAEQVAAEVTTTQVVPAGKPEIRTATADGDDAREAAHTRPPLEGAEWEDKPQRRTSAHLWGLLAGLVLAPVAWFFITDGVMRLFYSLQEVTDSPNIAGFLSLGGGLACLLILALVTRASSLGAWIWGGVLTAAGLVFLVIPQSSAEWMESSREGFLVIHEQFGQNVYDYLYTSGRSGLLLTYGVIILLFALIAHTTRRAGRREERAKAAAQG